MEQSQNFSGEQGTATSRENEVQTDKVEAFRNLQSAADKFRSEAESATLKKMELESALKKEQEQREQLESENRKYRDSYIKSQAFEKHPELSFLKDEIDFSASSIKEAEEQLGRIAKKLEKIKESNEGETGESESEGEETPEIESGKTQAKDARNISPEEFAKLPRKEMEKILKARGEL